MRSPKPKDRRGRQQAGEPHVDPHRSARETSGVIVPLILAVGAALVQSPPLPQDTTRTQRLGDLEVTVARGRDTLARLPMAAAVIRRETITAAQPTIGLDEALTTIPGVHVANRWNFSLDQRLSIRGAGSRANFGVRGVRILLDGVPQTLPDGQSQLTNVDYASLERIEVLRGAASALYGNASGGVLLLESAAPAPNPVMLGVGVEGGAFGSRKVRLYGSGRSDEVDGTWSLSRFTTDGYRQHSRADLRQGTLAVRWRPTQATTVTTRIAIAHTPASQNPGALTIAEAAADPTLAAPNNLSRGADKRVRQQQVSIAVQHRAGSAWSFQGAAFGLYRQLENPLATPPPGPGSATAGTYNQIDRSVVGGRAEAQWAGVEGRVRVTFGLDGQRMRDDRENRRSISGAPTDSVLARQQEVLSEVGPFGQVTWHPHHRVTLLAGARMDAIAFRTTDQHFTDGSDQSGSQTMAEPSANLGVGWSGSTGLSIYGRLGTAFETPTSTELVTTSAGSVGFNDQLGPQRTLGLELGGRGEAGPLSWNLALFHNRIQDAIVQASEQGGRAFFENAAQSTARGLELGAAVTPSAVVSFALAWTAMDYRFDEYRRRSAPGVDTLDGKRVAGVPRQYLRLGATLWPVPQLTLFLDQSLSGALYADDANALEVAGWGAGVTNLRARGTTSFGGALVAPFVAVMNAFDRRYIGSVTINGFGGRVLEPSPGRYLFLGVDLVWAAPAR